VAHSNEEMCWVMVV